MFVKLFLVFATNNYVITLPRLLNSKILQYLSTLVDEFNFAV